MRTVLSTPARHGIPDHIGLAYDVWAPAEADTGKLPEDDPKTQRLLRTEWFKQLAARSVSSDYTFAFCRYRRSLLADDSRSFLCRAESRLLIGHGNPSGSDVGLTVHHTWGVPILPGSALKGLLNHYVDACYGPAAAARTHPEDPRHGEPDRAPYQGHERDERGHPVHTPGAVHRALFGAATAGSDRAWGDILAARPEAAADRAAYLADRVGECAGLVVFHDALFVPGSAGNQPFAADVLTVHQKQYYDHQGKGANAPNDWDKPNPVAFLSVRPGTEFLVALSGPPEWTAFAAALLSEALREWGIGAKTAAGYGRLEADLAVPAPAAPGAQAMPTSAAATPAPPATAGANPAPAEAAPAPLAETWRGASLTFQRGGGGILTATFASKRSATARGEDVQTLLRDLPGPERDRLLGKGKRLLADVDVAPLGNAFVLTAVRLPGPR